MKGYLLVSSLYFMSVLQASLQGPCYTSECKNGEFLQDCIHGQWQCNFTEFCQVRIHDHVITECREYGHWTDCTGKEAINPSSCDPSTLHHAECTYCCDNNNCVQQLVTAPPKNCFTNQCGGHSSDLTHCFGDTWNCGFDEYCEVITHSADLTSTQCIGIYGIEGDANRWEMQCLPIHTTHSNPNVKYKSLQECLQIRDRCQYCDPNSHARACIMCATSFHEFESEVRNTVSSLLSTTPSAEHPAQSSTTHTVSTQPSAAEETTTTTTLTPMVTTTMTAAPPTATCVQCGDYDHDMPCTGEETLDDTETPCTGGGAYCMTHALIDSTRTTSIYKRCVNETVCRTMWYEQTADNQICMNFDLSRVTSDLACHFCCHGGRCNVNIVPAQGTWFVPVG